MHLPGVTIDYLFHLKVGKQWESCRESGYKLY